MTYLDTIYPKISSIELETILQNRKRSCCPWNIPFLPFVSFFFLMLLFYFLFVFLFAFFLSLLFFLFPLPLLGPTYCVLLVSFFSSSFYFFVFCFWFFLFSSSANSSWLVGYCLFFSTSSWSIMERKHKHLVKKWFNFLGIARPQNVLMGIEAATARKIWISACSNLYHFLASSPRS